MTRGAWRMAAAWRGSLPALLPPVLAWVVAGMGLLMMASMNALDPLQGVTWARSDSGHYLNIATIGYEVHRCTPADFSGTGWCGNAAWFPAYPVLVSVLDGVGLPLLASAIVLSWLLALATLIALWRTFLRDAPRDQALAALAFAAFVPGLVYHYSVFPLSLLGLTMVLSLWWASRGQWLRAGLAGAIAAATYPLGVVLIPVTAGWIVVTGRKEKPRELLRRVALSSGVASVGVFAVALLMRLQSGYWDAFFKVQEKYGAGVHNPLDTLFDRAKPVFQGGFEAAGEAPHLQTAFLTAVLLGLAAHTLARRRQASASDWLVLAASLTMWVVALAQTNVSLHRSAAALLPMAVLIRRLPAPVGVLLAGGALWISAAIARMFFLAHLG